MKKKNHAVIIGIILAVCGAVCVFFAVYFDREKNPVDYDIITEAVRPISESFTQSVKYQSPIDFESLKKDSPDIIAWLNIEGTEINYPVLFREGDNSYYLRRNTQGKYDKNGSLFIEDYNKTDFTDPVSIIYGHHMSSGAMFGRLQSIYTNPDTFNEFNKITLYFPKKELIYRVFCAVPLDNSHILYYHNFNNEKVFENYFEEIFQTRSLLAVFDETVALTPEDKILMLSTCFSDDYSRRFVVMAVQE